MLLSDPVQINGVKLIGNASEASMEHLKAMERRAINLWGETIGKTLPVRQKKICMYNVSKFVKNFSFFCHRNFLKTLKFPTFLNVISNLFQLILPKKLTERFITLGSDIDK